MTVWYHLTTIFRRCFFVYRHRFFLPFAGIIVLCVALITTLYFALPAFAAPNVTRTVGFQGRLLNAAGVPVPDGSYNVQFKLYEGGTGTEEGNPNGELVWTETYKNSENSQGITVKNGFLTVDLGAVTPFGTLVDWENDTIWLSVNVAGNAADCSVFNEGDCLADGEMLPMKRISATPYAINAGAVNGKTASDLVQLGQGAQTDAGNLSSLFINKTGSGNFIQLQNAATDVFTVKNNGDIEFGSDTNHLISLQGSGDDTIGRDLGISAGSGGSGEGANGGALTLQGGDAGGINGNGGDVVIGGGKGAGSGSDGLVIISTPTFKTAEQQACDQDCTVIQSNIDSNGAIILNAEIANISFTLDDPTNKTAGRVIYATAATDSERFTLAINGGIGAHNKIPMKPGATATLFWNGSDWTTSSLSTGDELPLQTGSAKNIQVGNGNDDENTTLITLDKSASAPVVVDESLVGSMYYDTTLGKVQCYEADGWGDCGTAPDTFVSMSPEYSNAVKQGNGIGELTSGLCSSDLGINDGTNSQPEICGENETHNFYNWTSGQATAQTKSIYITQELPNSFKEFVDESIQLLGRTDSTDASINYQLYRKSGTGLTACGTATTVSTGTQTEWQQANGPDVSGCDFAAGDSIVIRINLISKNDANAYISTFKFAFSNK